MLQNQTDGPIVVDVAMRVSNLILESHLGQRVKIPAHERVEVRFPARADKTGTARYQVAVSSGRFSDAQQGLSCLVARTTEAFATYGVLDEGLAVQGVRMPTDIAGIWPAEISTSSTASFKHSQMRSFIWCSIRTRVANSEP